MNNSPPQGPGQSQNGRPLSLDPRNLRGLAHPLRVRIRAALVDHGPATATQLATRLGLSSGATSYHLRQLARYGFVGEDPDRGHGRERYWHVTHLTVQYDPGTATGDPDLAGIYLRAVAQLYADRMIRFVDEVGDDPAVLGADWVDAWTISSWSLSLTAKEAHALVDHLADLFKRRAEHSGLATPGARQVTVQLQLLPARPDADA